MLKYCQNLPFGLHLIGDSVVKKDDWTSSERSLNQIKRIVNHFIKHPDPLVVPIYEWISEEKKVGGSYPYSYTMKRLFILSQEERIIVDRSYYYFKKINNPSIDIVETIEQGKINYPHLIEFCKQVLEQDRYWDFHKGNVLKDEQGDYKLIDLEGFVRTTMDWIKDDNEAA